MGFARKMSRLGTKTIDSHPTSAIPDGECEARALLKKTGDARLPISTILGCRFPDQQLICSLLEDYFDAVHWFSLVIYEPNFRERLSYIKDGYAYHAESPFLVLLSMVLCMAAWYRSKRVTPEAAEEWRLWSDDLLQIVEPKSSSDTSSDAEERKRVWWTVYTWDRFASISYGRPLSIKDEDCNAGMPAEFSESPYFVENAVDKELPAIVYSPYQTELSKLYLIASPALTAIFGSISTPTSKEKFESSYALLVSDVTQRLIAWHQQLPPNLTLDLDLDFDPRNSIPQETQREVKTSWLESKLKPKTIHSRYPFKGKPLLWMTCAFGSLGDALFGYDQGIIAGLLVNPVFISKFFSSYGAADGSSDNINPSITGIFVACLQVSAAVGSLVSGSLGDMIGRKKCVRLGGFIYFFTAFIQAFAPDFRTFIIGRTIQGLGVGFLSMTVPVIQTEIAAPHRRGLMVGIEYTFLIGGYALSTWVDFGFYYLIPG
ncbi:high-affinity glucose transporter [Purpureocillium lavendulum]|uniref:High-affinity glucose transporter n=1 Tax=Purpureocillium lavendulum TaxID=1247861 RepID=A0AB34FJB5_9HYPO|nr:high-affinity glucose transporter [Purpureocillium lavendulum]